MIDQDNNGANRESDQQRLFNGIIKTKRLNRIYGRNEYPVYDDNVFIAAQQIIFHGSKYRRFIGSIKHYFPFVTGDI